MRVHRVGSPDSQDFDVLEIQAPPLRPLPRGQRIAQNYVQDLENTNEWPNPTDYLLLGDGFEEGPDEEEKTSKRSAMTLNRVRGELGLVKKAKTEGEPTAAITITQVRQKKQFFFFF